MVRTGFARGVTVVTQGGQCPGGTAAVVEHFNELRAELAVADGVTASKRLTELDAAAAVLDGLRMLAVARVDQSQVWRDDPNATTTSYLRSHHRRSHKESAADLRAATAFTTFPALREAVDTGAVSRAHVDVIVAVGLRNPSRAEALPDFLPAFLQIAAHHPATTLRQVMRRWADQIDPLTTATDEHDAHRRRYLHVAHLADGVALEGFFGHDQGTKILAAMNAALTDQFRHPTTDTDGGDGGGNGGEPANATGAGHSSGVPGSGMPVSTSQQRADAFINLIDRLLTNGGLPSCGGSRPTVTVVVPLARLEQPCTGADPHDLLKHVTEHHDQPDQLLRTGSAHLSVSNGPGDHLISSQTAQQLTCDCDIHRIVLNPDGLPLDVGRKARTFPPHLRKALEIRDGGCIYPGCTKPPGWAEAHHIIHWAQGGQTSLDNAALLCSRHHHEIHHNNHTITIGPNGKPTITLHRQRL